MAMSMEHNNEEEQEMTAPDREDGLLLGEVEVAATRAPLPADKSVRLVQVINRQDIEASSAQSVNDLLKLAAGVDVRQRGGFGIQTDIGVNGGTEDQLTVLLNGINISNPHTGHLTVDLPVNVDDIERIDTSMSKDDFEKALNLCADINDHWNEMAWMVDALLIHDYVDGVGLSLAQMQRYIENGSPDLYFAESEKAKRALASLKDSEYPTTENIF